MQDSVDGAVFAYKLHRGLALIVVAPPDTGDLLYHLGRSGRLEQDPVDAMKVLMGQIAQHRAAGVPIPVAKGLIHRDRVAYHRTRVEPAERRERVCIDDRAVLSRHQVANPVMGLGAVFVCDVLAAIQDPDRLHLQHGTIPIPPTRARTLLGMLSTP